MEKEQARNTRAQEMHTGLAFLQLALPGLGQGLCLKEVKGPGTIP